MQSTRHRIELILGVAALFLGGLATGLSVPRGTTTQAEPSTSILRVAGNDVSGRSAASNADRSPREAYSRSAPAVASAPSQPPVAPRSVAEHALDFTAFIRGGNAYGAGILLDDQGHVLTCHHVIEGADVITVSFADAGHFTAEVVEIDRQLDLALLKIPTTRSSKARLASVASVEMGDDIFGMGAPRKLRFSLSRGLVSFVGRPFSNLYYLQTDLPTNGGNSGGPVMNDRGDVVGITSFIYRDTQGLSFALPIDYAFARFERHLHGVTLDRSAFAAWERDAKKRGFVD